MQRHVINAPEGRESVTFVEPPRYVPPQAIDNPELPEIQPRFSAKERLRVYRVERHGTDDCYVLIAEVETLAEGLRIANSQRWQTRVMRYGDPRGTRSNWQPVKPEAGR